MNEISIWGIKINPLKKKEIVEIIDKHLGDSDKTFQLTGVNPETITHAQSSPDLKKAINESDIVNIDNMLVVMSLRLLGYKIPERSACPDIFEMLLDLGNKKGYTMYFLGAREEILQTMMKNLRIKYPELIVAGSRNGYFDPQEEQTIVDEIAALSPHMLFIALPTPQKEVFINRYKSSLTVGLAFGVGGAFDVQAGKVRRAPRWMRSIGLEGVHRAVQNPSDYGARYKSLYVPFLKLVCKEAFGKISARHHE